MDTSIDYSTYTRAELIDARSTIDADAFPERAAELDRLIAEMDAQSATAENTKKHQVLRQVPVLFHGNTKEFFSIWIVNLLLTIVTLGIYSAWAKVRTNRYFYGNTEIDGHRFAYLATPIQILKGRIIAVVLFATYFVVSSINPLAGTVLAILLALAMPYFVIMSHRFRMRMTAYRNVRFNFAGRYGTAFLLFVVLPICSVFTLYLLFPYVLKKIDEFLVNETGFGDRKFTTALSPGEYYATAILTVLIAGGIFFIGSIALGGLSGASGGFASGGFSLFSIGIFAMYLLAYAVSSAFYAARIRNHIFAKTELADVATFSSDMGAGDLIVLRLTNVLATVFTLGMAIPWVKVRTAQFYAAATHVSILEGINSVVEEQHSNAGALGEEASNLFDLDIALG